MSLRIARGVPSLRPQPNPCSRSILRRHISSGPRTKPDGAPPTPTATKPPSPPAPAPSAARPSSIPGPSWAWIEPLAAPFRAYGRMQARSPYMTQLSSSLTIYFLGDLSAQMVAGAARRREDTVVQQDEAEPSSRAIPSEPARGSQKEHAHAYAPERGLRAMLIGGISAIPSYHWFLFLGRHFNYGSHVVSIAVKIVVNQSFFTPVFNTYFFGMHSFLSGNGWRETKRRVLETVPVSWRTSWKVWPVVTAFSFTFVKPQYRSVTAGVFAIGWQTYLSWLNGRAAKGNIELAPAVGGEGGQKKEVWTEQNRMTKERR